MLEKFMFSKKVYPIFRKEVKRVHEYKKTIFLWQNEDDKLKIITVFKEALVFFMKEKNQPLTIVRIALPEKFKLKTELDISFKELKTIILAMKDEGMLLDSQHIVEFLNTNLRSSIQYYGLTRKEVAEIFNEIVIINAGIFQNNPPAIVEYNIANKWID